MDGKIFYVFPTRSAEEFLDRLSLRSGWMREGRPNWMMFRGQPDTRFKLIPALFRPTAHVRYHREWLPTTILHGLHLIHAEIETLRQFCYRADDAGLSLPQHLYPLDQTFDNARNQLSEDNLTAWPPVELLPILGLAQHYGLPTRLLDWSRSPLIAAYFAAIGAVTHGGVQPQIKGATTTIPSIAVYALRVSRIVRDSESRPSIVVVSPPRAGNPNLNAQRGVFTLTRGTPEETQQPLERTLQSIGAGVVMRKITLPGKQAPQLLRLLAIEGISASVLFPGYGGAAIGTMEERYWDKRFSSKAQILRDLGLPAHVWPPKPK